MNKPAVVIPIVIIVNACIWGFAMVMSSIKLSGTGHYPLIQHILSGSAGASLIVVGGGLAGLRKSLKTSEGSQS
jgi:hypothetical protein